MTANGVHSAPPPVWAWGGAALFAISLGYFLFSYAVTFGGGTSGAFRPADLVWNIALFTAFALHHSVFARPGIRTLVARTVPLALERTLYVTVASLLFMVVCAAWRSIPGRVWAVAGAGAWVLWAIQGAGVWLAIRSAMLIDAATLAGLAAPREGPAEFRRDGPYGWVRHPIYVGWFLIVFATPVMTMTRLSFAVVSGLYILAAIPFEERTMHAAGGAYARYADDVKWKLVPGVF